MLKCTKLFMIVFAWGKPKLVKDDETIAQIEILEEGIRQMKERNH